MIDSKRLREEIKKRGLRLGWMAERLEISYQAFWKKLNGQSNFSAADVWEIKKILGLSDEEVESIFFAKDVDNSSTEAER